MDAAMSSKSAAICAELLRIFMNFRDLFEGATFNATDPSLLFFGVVMRRRLTARYAREFPFLKCFIFRSPLLFLLGSVLLTNFFPALQRRLFFLFLL